jgi:hypothetical protein
MQAVVRTRRVFVSGQLVEYWENGDVPFGWENEDLQAYVDGGRWVLLFNALVLTGPRPRAEHVH